MYNVQCIMYDVWCMMYDIWCMMYDVWCMRYDVWCMMYDVWYMMYDVWCMVVMMMMMMVMMIMVMTKAFIDSILTNNVCTHHAIDGIVTLRSMCIPQGNTGGTNIFNGAYRQALHINKITVGKCTRVLTVKSVVTGK